MEILELLGLLIELFTSRDSSRNSKRTFNTNPPRVLNLFAMALLVVGLVAIGLIGLIYIYIIIDLFPHHTSTSWGTATLCFSVSALGWVAGLYTLFRLRIVSSFRLLNFVLLTLTLAIGSTMLLLFFRS